MFICVNNIEFSINNFYDLIDDECKSFSHLLFRISYEYYTFFCSEEVIFILQKNCIQYNILFPSLELLE